MLPLFAVRFVVHIVLDIRKSNQEGYVNIANVYAGLFDGEWFYRKLSLTNGDLH